MVAFYFILGLIMTILGFLVGVNGGSLLIGLIVGVGSGAIFFGIGVIIENQMTIQKLLKESIEKLPPVPIEKTNCSRCGREYTIDLISCPYCGHRDHQ